ncbi:MAG TPA: hypothetical protein PLJ16_02150, partial [Casimicrobium huifangae]|nr:hypothetical protein [Casimicrobium huifangae]
MRVLRSAVVALISVYCIAQACAASSAQYVEWAGITNAGVASSASSQYLLSASVGDAVLPLRANSANYRLRGGFWGAVVGLRQGCVLDVDGDQTVNALTDGVIILRALLGLSGDSLIAGAVGAGATRTTAARIEPFVHLAALDLDGDGNAAAASDGVMLLRAMFGMRGANVTSGAATN